MITHKQSHFIQISRNPSLILSTAKNIQESKFLSQRYGQHGYLAQKAHWHCLVQRQFPQTAEHFDAHHRFLKTEKVHLVKSLSLSLSSSSLKTFSSLVLYLASPRASQNYFVQKFVTKFKIQFETSFSIFQMVISMLHKMFSV